jgi:DNA-binding IscR family transcriptional regulator
VRVNWRRINQAIAQALDSVKLSDMMKPTLKKPITIPARLATV